MYPHFTSPCVIATKATAPFFRLAIDYRWLNQFVTMIQAHVPVILEEIHKAKGWRYFGDIDWSEAFHQIKLGPKTAELMSIITHLGPLQPEFMMEGVAPASSVLQNTVAGIFLASSRSTAKSRAIVAKYCVQDCNLVHHLMNKV